MLNKTSNLVVEGKTSQKGGNNYLQLSVDLAYCKHSSSQPLDPAVGKAESDWPKELIVCFLEE